jgi:RimJ/RimL family protein N-acetyltransferase
MHLTVDVPILETERLTLRQHRLEDFRASARMWADPNVTRHIRDMPFSEEETWSRLLRYIGHWALLGFGYWVVEEKKTGAFIGEVGFADYKRDLQPSLQGMPEIGWVFATAAHGKGYATEAVRSVVAWGDVNLDAKQTACIIAPDHAASIRVAQKAGYRELQPTTYHGHPTVIYIRDRG